MDIELQHLIYTLVPNKGYGVRAWSSKEIIYDIENSFKSYFSPYEQAVVRPGYELRAIARSPKDYLYLARVFQADKLDEMNRSGVVSHIVALPINILLDKKIALELIDKTMYSYETSKGCGLGEIASKKCVLGEIEPIKLEIEENEVDPDIDYFRKIITEEKARKILTGIAKPYGKVIIIYKRDIWSRIKLTYAISKVLALTQTLKEFFASTDKPLDNLLIEYENIIMVLDKIISIKQVGDWSVVKIDDEKETKELDIEDIIKKVYL